MDIKEIRVTDLTDSVGAAKMLSCSTEMVRQYVKQDKLRSFLFNEDGVFAARQPGALTRGKDLFFLRQDVAQLPRRSPGRPPKQA